MQTGISSQVAITDYLTLLTVQLKNQDPIDPVKQEDFLTQLSQFSMLEGIENLNTSFGDILHMQEISQGVDLVGKQIQYQDPLSGETKVGEVERFLANSDALHLLVDGEAVPISMVSGVIA